MAKTDLNSFLTSLNGHYGDSVYYTIGRKTYVRKYVKPHNPGSEAQQSQRLLFAEAMASWKLLTEVEKQIYKKKAKKLSMHGHNLFIKRYIRIHKHEKTSEIKSSCSAEPLSRPYNLINNIQGCTSSEATLYLSRTSFYPEYIQSIYTPPV
ncbi:MAG TPA: hypothetical protein PKG60_05650 [Spirochaetota bacterium]|nr:hypothetical protein [Spirochaetota bacterium]HPS86676.1 hypothetical protein [Spirochaetota bacterium]